MRNERKEEKNVQGIREKESRRRKERIKEVCMEIYMVKKKKTVLRFDSQK